MKPSSFIYIISIYLFCTWHKASSTPFYVTPHQSCGSTCQGTIEQPFDNFLFALQAAASADSPVIIFLANSTVDHYVLAAERDYSGDLLYNFSTPLSFNFTTLEIKPLFCDEVGNLTIPEDTKCIERNDTLTIYLKTLMIDIGVNSQLTVQNIVFNGLEALSDYMADNTVDYSGCTQQRTRCCQSPAAPTETPGNPDNEICYYDQDGNQHCIIVTPPTDSTGDENCSYDENGNEICTPVLPPTDPGDESCYYDENGNRFCSVVLPPEYCYYDENGNQFCSTIPPTFSDADCYEDEDGNEVCASIKICYHNEDGTSYCQTCHNDDGVCEISYERRLAQSPYTCNPSNSKGTGIVLESIFRIDDPVSPTSTTTRQQINFVKTGLQYFWGRSIGSFVRINASPYISVTFENSTLDDCFFERGLVYVAGAGDQYSSDAQALNSQVTFENMNFTNYNKWYRYLTTYYVHYGTSFIEGYLLVAEQVFRGTLNILESTFSNISAVSRFSCDYVSEDTNYRLVYWKIDVRTDLWSLCTSRTRGDFLSSLIYIPLMGGSMNIKNSTFRQIGGIEGSVLRVDQVVMPFEQGDISTSFNITDSIFDGNSAVSRFTNILITHQSGPPQYCPVVNIQNCKFLNSFGCGGGYGNVGLMCLYDRDIVEGARIFDGVNSPYDLPVLITVSDSIFQNNMIGLSNSLAIIGSYSTVLERNIFQDNGGTTGDYLLQYSQVRTPIIWTIPQRTWPPGYDPQTAFGQSTAVYIQSFFLLQSIGNIYSGNFGPWQGSQALASSLTLLQWNNVYNAISHSTTILPLLLQDDKFIDHLGVPAGIIPQNIVDHLNCYTPPIITLGNTYQSYEDSWGSPPDIIFRGVKFSGNTVNYAPIKNRCGNMIADYYQPTRFVNMIDSNSRYRSGFFKFLTPSEQSDQGQLYENTLDPTIANMVGGTDLKFVYSDGEISNNILISEGCLFPTLRLRYYTLDNLNIEGNQLNPAQEAQVNTTFMKQADATDIINNRAGIFCGFQKDSILTLRNLNLVLKNSQVQNNVGPVINLYPDELNYLTLSNSVFTNNTCEYTSTIIALEGASVTSLNNTFIQNNNMFGSIFLTSSSTQLSDTSSTYINNTGRHASLFYADNKATIVQIDAQVQGNTINPVYPLFNDNLMPQGGLYFLSSSSLTVQSSNFSENTAYGGFVISTGGTVTFAETQVANHSFMGMGLIGNFLYGSTLTINDANLTNNSVTANSQISFPPSFIKCVVGIINVSNIRIFDAPVPNAASMLYGNNIEGTLTNIIMSNLNAPNGTPLISLLSSDLTINNLQTNDTTSVFSSYDSKLVLNSISIRGLKPSEGSIYLIDTGTSELAISRLNYTGDADRGDYLSLIKGAGNIITIIESHYVDAVYGNNKIFDVRESSLFVVTGSTFEYTSLDKQPLIFNLKSSKIAVIDNCIFSKTAQIIQSENTEKSLYFLGNTILTDPYTQIISTTENNAVNFVSNNFLASYAGEANEPSFNSQIQVVDTLNLTNLQDNVFFSLHGSQGVVQIQGDIYSYNMTSTENIFVNNIGALGGALYLDASLSSTSTVLPQATIDSCVFLLNKAIRTGDGAGKGGAIYQTSSTRIQQHTTISNSSFVKNSADTIGGAIYFDYLPPNVDTISQFINNSANNNIPNHIGSYPVRLAYYEGEPDAQAPFIPNQSYSRYLTSTEIPQWNNIPSGLTSENTYTFALVDMFGQVVFSDNSSVLQVNPNGLDDEDKYIFSNKLSISAQNGLYTFDNFKFIYKTYATVNVTFTSTAIDNRQIPVQPPLAPSDSIVIETHFRGCERGEYVLNESDVISCVECQPGFWQTSPIPDAIACQACNTDSTFCLGANQVGPKKNYWRLNETANIVTECPISGACLGSEDGMDPQGKCADKYTGNLCSNCISGWAKVGNGKCTNCSTDSWYYLRVVIVLIVQLILTAKAIQGTMNISEEFSQNQSLKLNGAILIRILTNYLQLISLVAGLPVTWPGVLKSFSSASNQVSSVSENVFTLDCLFKSDHVLGMKVIFFKILVSTIGPFALVAVAALFTAIYFKIKKRPILRNSSFTNQIVATAVVICFMMQPTAIKSGFSLFQCDNLYRDDKPVYFFEKDYDVQCWQGAHFYWAIGLGIPVLFTWSIGLPYIVFRALKKNKTRLDSPEVAQKYSFLYGGYSSQKYYWELVVMLRKFILIGVTLGASFHSTNLEIYFSVLLILFWYFLHDYTHPYSDLKLNRLEQIGLVSAGVINLCGLYFKFVPSQAALDIIIIIFGLIANILFFAYFGLLFFALQIEKLLQNPKVVEILTFLGKKFKCLEPKKIEALLKKLVLVTDRISKRRKRNGELSSAASLKYNLDEKQKVEEGAEEQNLKEEKEQSGVTLKNEKSFHLFTNLDGDGSPEPLKLDGYELSGPFKVKKNSGVEENNESNEADEVKCLSKHTATEMNESVSEVMTLSAVLRIDHNI